jgi:hypothetical protein
VITPFCPFVIFQPDGTPADALLSGAVYACSAGVAALAAAPAVNVAKLNAAAVTSRDLLLK